MFDVMKQSYLLTVQLAERPDRQASRAWIPIQKRRVEFFTKLLTDAFSPSNFLISNPAALREAMRSQGESLLKGAERFAADLERGGGKLTITQTDLDRVQGGRERRHRPGQGGIRERRCSQLLQFSPSTDAGAEDPAADLPAVDQQVLHPRPAPREFDDPLAVQPGLHRLRHLLGQSGRRARPARRWRTISTKAPTTAIDR